MDNHRIPAYAPTTDPDAIARRAQMDAAIDEMRSDRGDALHRGLPALKRLYRIARSDTGQARTVRRLLLAIYNGYEHRFDLTDLRTLDTPIVRDALAVLRLDAHGIREVHDHLDSHYTADAAPTFERWAREALS